MLAQCCLGGVHLIHRWHVKNQLNVLQVVKFVGLLACIRCALRRQRWRLGVRERGRSRHRSRQPRMQAHCPIWRVWLPRLHQRSRSGRMPRRCDHNFMRGCMPACMLRHAYCAYTAHTYFCFLSGDPRQTLLHPHLLCRRWKLLQPCPACTSTSGACLLDPCAGFSAGRACSRQGSWPRAAARSHGRLAAAGGSGGQGWRGGGRAEADGASGADAPDAAADEAHGARRPV